MLIKMCKELLQTIEFCNFEKKEEEKESENEQHFIITSIIVFSITSQK